MYVATRTAPAGVGRSASSLGSPAGAGRSVQRAPERPPPPRAVSDGEEDLIGLSLICGIGIAGASTPTPPDSHDLRKHPRGLLAALGGHWYVDRCAQAHAFPEQRSMPVHGIPLLLHVVTTTRIRLGRGPAIRWHSMPSAGGSIRMEHRVPDIPVRSLTTPLLHGVDAGIPNSGATVMMANPRSRLIVWEPGRVQR
jgi:hypothetical protein